jgi:hypothetical protein
MTRLTNAFSKKMENHAHAMALHFLCYNFVRIHRTHRITSAMAAGVTDRLWEMADIVRMPPNFPLGDLHHRGGAKHDAVARKAFSQWAASRSASVLTRRFLEKFLRRIIFQ